MRGTRIKPRTTRTRRSTSRPAWHCSSSIHSQIAGSGAIQITAQLVVLCCETVWPRHGNGLLSCQDDAREALVAASRIVSAIGDRRTREGLHVAHHPDDEGFRLRASGTSGPSLTR
jgi:hypothetical protein